MHSHYFLTCLDDGGELGVPSGAAPPECCQQTPIGELLLQQCQGLPSVRVSTGSSSTTPLPEVALFPCVSREFSMGSLIRLPYNALTPPGKKMTTIIRPELGELFPKTAGSECYLFLHDSQLSASE